MSIAAPTSGFRLPPLNGALSLCEANQADSSSNTVRWIACLTETVKVFGNEGYESRPTIRRLEKWETARRKTGSLFVLHRGTGADCGAGYTADDVLAGMRSRRRADDTGDFVL